MRILHRLTATVDISDPIPTEDGAHVAGTIEVVSECDPSGRAVMRCRAVDEDVWHCVLGARTSLSDPADLPFHHAAVLSRLLTRSLSDDGYAPDAI